MVLAHAVVTERITDVVPICTSVTTGTGVKGGCDYGTDNGTNKVACGHHRHPYCLTHPSRGHFERTATGSLTTSVIVQQMASAPKELTRYHGPWWYCLAPRPCPVLWVPEILIGHTSARALCVNGVLATTHVTDMQVWNSTNIQSLCTYEQSVIHATQPWPTCTRS